MKVSEIKEILDHWMPISIAEDFDNVGLIVGDLNSEVKNILVTLDTTQNVVDEIKDAFPGATVESDDDIDDDIPF